MTETRSGRFINLARPSPPQPIAKSAALPVQVASSHKTISDPTTTDASRVEVDTDGSDTEGSSGAVQRVDTSAMRSIKKELKKTEVWRFLSRVVGATGETGVVEHLDTEYQEAFRDGDVSVLQELLGEWQQKKLVGIGANVEESVESVYDQLSMRVERWNENRASDGYDELEVHPERTMPELEELVATRNVVFCELVGLSMLMKGALSSNQWQFDKTPDRVRRMQQESELKFLRSLDGGRRAPKRSRLEYVF